MDNILKTLAYFDIFNTPLTREELSHWLWEEKVNDYTDFARRLNNLEKEKKIAKKYGFYFFPGREEIINTSQRAVSIVEEKMQIAVRAGKKIRWIPFVEAIFVCNTVAGGGVKKESDIDVFIIIKNGRLWLSRLLTTIALSIFSLRRNKKRIANKICLSFYATNDGLDFSKIKIADPDIYLIYWLENLIPVYDPNNALKKIKYKNQWAKKYLPNADSNYQTLYRWTVTDSKLSKAVRSFFEKIWQEGYGDLLENQAKKIQQTKIKLNFSNPNKENKLGVIINDHMLKFHENDRREQFQNEWLKNSELRIMN